MISDKEMDGISDEWAKAVIKGLNQCGIFDKYGVKSIEEIYATDKDGNKLFYITNTKSKEEDVDASNNP